MLKDLYDHVVGSVAKNWKVLGAQLLRSTQTHELDIIAINYPQDVVGCCKCVLEKWLESSVDATWIQLIKALRRPGVQLNYFASELEQRLKPECKIIAMYLLMKYKCLYRSCYKTGSNGVKGDKTNDCILIIVLKMHAQKPSHNTHPPYKEDCCITYIGVKLSIYKDHLKQCACH